MITIVLPFYKIPLFNVCYEISESWIIRPFINLKIIDLKRTIQSFIHQIEHKWKTFEGNKRLDLTLKILNTDQKVTLHFDKKIKISEKICYNTLVLTEDKMVDLLFGYCRTNKLPVFPLEFYVWPLDRI